MFIFSPMAQQITRQITQQVMQVKRIMRGGLWFSQPGLFRFFQRHLMLWRVFCLIVGIAFAPLLPLIETIWLICLIAGLICGAMLMRWFFAGRRPLVWLLVSFIISFLAGIALHHLEIARHHYPVLQAAQSASLTAEILDIEPRAERLRLRLNILDSPDPDIAGLHHLRLSVQRHEDRLQIGDHIHLRARLFPHQPPFFQGRPDYAKQLWLDGISATGYITSFSRMEHNTPSPAPSMMHSVTARFDQIRRHYAARLSIQMAAPEAAVAAALLVGRKQGISNAHYDDFRRSGLAHLLAISGLHMGFFCFGVYGVIRAITAFWRWPDAHISIHKPAACLAILAGLFYLGLAGAPISATRAWLMASLVMGAVLTDRRAITLRTLALIAGLMLSVHPALLATAGFQLSFIASFAIVAGLGRLQGFLSSSSMSAPIRAVLLVGLTSFLASIATMPFIAYHFQQFTAYSLIANLLAVPLTGLVIMPLGILSLALAPFGADGLILPLLEVAIRVLNGWAALIASAPYAGIWIKPPPAPLLLLMTFIWLMWAVWPKAAGQQVPSKAAIQPMNLLFKRLVFSSLIFISAAIWVAKPLPDALLLRQYGQMVWILPDRNHPMTSGQLSPFWSGLMAQQFGLHSPIAACANNCRLDSAGEHVIFIHQRWQLTAACRQGAADLVITPFEPLYPCGNPVHHLHLRSGENLMVFLHDTDDIPSIQVDITSNIDGLPNRPWRF
ncbi:MAG: ComEC/Rec2 family competence protein [Candidatus Puniceispirillaceae bacterium]